MKKVFKVVISSLLVLTLMIGLKVPSKVFADGDNSVDIINKLLESHDPNDHIKALEIIEQKGGKVEKVTIKCYS